MIDPNFLKTGRILILVFIIGAIALVFWRFTSIDSTPEAPHQTETKTPEPAGPETATPPALAALPGPKRIFL